MSRTFVIPGSSAHEEVWIIKEKMTARKNGMKDFL
jgi:hypothetical protein